MLHDPEEYPEPHLFIPERFLNPDASVNENVRDPTTIAFGFGRRFVPYAMDASTAPQKRARLTGNL